VTNLLEEFDIDGLRSANELAESMYKTHRIHP
jgi:hypothetical protein